MAGLGGRTLKRTWRLVLCGAGSGSWNMALDEALAESVRSGGGPFLRFYTWSPATLSLGRFQNLQSGLTDLARQMPVVRRPTGGGGIWHADELTYSLGCTQEDLEVSGVKASFEKLCGFLVDAWKQLGWNAGFAKDGLVSGPLGVFTPACFAGQEEYDILVDGKKLGGNAQRRDRNSIFQHGSIPRVLDHAMLERLFVPEARPQASLVTDLHTCGWKGSNQELVSLLVDAFQKRLNVEWWETGPTAEERTRAEALENERFSDPQWTNRGGGALRGL